SKHVTIKEQLSIFPYACVMGLTIRHIREWFQQLNKTISKYLKKMLDVFSTPGIYAKYV
ncbi:hypothetical protein PAXRUDRAFT_82870, partial [Paxillus rubicundulus Ve08.2h10]